MKIAVVVAVTLLAVIAQSAESKEFSRGPLVYPVGAASCGSWIIARQEDNNVKIISTLAFAEGMITAFDIQHRNLRPVDGAGIKVFIDKWCASHPTETIMDAAFELSASLVVKGQ